MIEYVDAQKCYMTFYLNAAPISSRVRFFHSETQDQFEAQKLRPPAGFLFQFYQFYSEVTYNNNE